MNASLEEILSYTITGRGKSNSFFPMIINALRRIEVPGMGTFGVSIDKYGGLVLRYDPEVIKKLTFQQVTLVMIHEVYHLALNHIPRFLRLLDSIPTEAERKKTFRVANIAMDYAVNSLMVRTGECKEEDFKTMGTLDPRTNKHDFAGVFPTDVKLPVGQTFEWYLLELLENLEKYTEIISRDLGLEGTGTNDIDAILNEYMARQSPTSGHDDMDLESMTQEQVLATANRVEREAKKQVARAVDNMKKSRGNMPGGISELIEALLRPDGIPWRRLLSTWINNTLRKDRVRSKRRPKRRTLQGANVCKFPGRIGEDQYTLIFAIDTSGSMGGPELAAILGEMQRLQKATKNIQITVLECDTVIGKEYKVGPTDKFDYNLSGRGGTTFDPVFVRTRELKADALLYATDGYGPMPALKNRLKIPVIWCLTPGGVPPWEVGGGEPYGRILRVTKDDDE